MKTILYYFTGTGNSLAVARAIADRLPDTELIPMLLLDGEKIRAQKDANIGIISLLYTMGLPGIVVRFFDILDLSDAGYVFSVVTEGGTYGSPTSQIASLAKQSGHDLNAAWWIRMPDNYIPLSAPPAKPEQKTIREDALRKVAVLTEAVRERSLRQIDLITTGKLLRLVMYKPFMKNIPTFGKKIRRQLKLQRLHALRRHLPRQQHPGTSQRQKGMARPLRRQSCLPPVLPG